MAFGAEDDEDDKPEAKPEATPPPTAKPVTAEPVATKPAGGSDHDTVVGHMGFSWFGVSTIPIATGTPGGTGTLPAVAPGAPTTVSTPAIGIRYWLSEKLGLDVGGGFMISGGGTRNTSSGADKATVFSLLAHAGLPLQLAQGKHISLQLIPESNLGFAVTSVEPAQQLDPPPNASLSGVRFDLGARIGGEVHFGFMDIPELSLEGSIGAFMTYQATKIAVEGAYSSQSSVLLTTASYQNPWDIFTSYVRARYYF